MRQTRRGVLRQAVVSISTPRLLLTLPDPDAAATVLDYYAFNREHFTSWSPPLPGDFYTEGFWRDRLERNRREHEEGASLRLFVFDRTAPGGPPIGHCNFTEVVRGPLQACFLGYGCDRRSEGRGIMTEALSAAIAHAFTSMSLHRIQANYRPINERSGRLLRRLGFVVEGYARDYLYIDGEWRDHVLTAITNPRWKAPSPI